MSSTDADADDLIYSALSAYQEKLDNGGQDVAPESNDSQLSADAQARLAAARRCLQRLHEARDSKNESTSSPRLPQRVGRFEIRALLGVGGFGIVYRAWDPATQREVAIKTPRWEAMISAELRERFEQEARAAARLDHVNVVTVLEAGADGVIPYIASVYVPGETLAAWLSKQNAPVAPRQAAHWIASLADGVQHAHSRGVLHRDIKPSNVLLAPSGTPAAHDEHDRLVPKLMDFGLAKLAESQHDMTRSGVMLGTIRYMSPEQALGQTKQIGTASDVYSLGAVLYELLAGEVPFAFASDLEALRRIETEDPSSIRVRRPNVPRDLETICLKCLQKEPAKRYASAAELSHELHRYLAGEPIAARRSGAVEITAKWVKRRPLGAALLAVLALSVIGLVTGLLLHSRRVTELLRIAEHEREAARAAARVADERAAEARRNAYAADLQLALESWTGSAGDKARETLARHVPRPGEPDERDFVWWYLHNLTRESSIVGRHEGGVTAVAASPDGQLLATGGRDGRLRIWEARTRLLRADWQGHRPGPINSLEFSPDSRILASVADDHPVRLWKAASGEALRPLVGSQDWNADVAFSPDGRWIAAGGADCKVRVWSMVAETGPVVLEGHRSTIKGIIFSKFGGLLSSSDDGEIRAWSTSTMAPDARVDGILQRAGEPQVYDFAWRGDGAIIVGAQWTDGFQAWDVRPEAFGKKIPCPSDFASPRAVTSNPESVLAFGNASGHLILSGTREDATSLFRTRHGHRERINGVAYVPSTREWLTGSNDGTARLFAPLQSLRDGNGSRATSAIALRWRGRQLVSVCRSGIIFVYDLDTRDTVHQFVEFKDDPYAADIAPSKNRLAVINTNQNLTVYRLPEKERLWHHALEGRWNRVDMDARERHVLVTSAQELRVYDLEGGSLVHAFRHPADVSAFAQFPDSPFICTASLDGGLRIWNIDAGKLVEHFQGFAGAIQDLAISRDGRRVVARAEREYRVWDRNGWKLVGAIPEHGRPMALALLDEGDVMVVHSPDTGLHFYRVSDGTKLLGLGNRHPVAAMAVSPDGEMIATQKDLYLDFIDGRAAP